MWSAPQLKTVSGLVHDPASHAPGPLSTPSLVPDTSDKQRNAGDRGLAAPWPCARERGQVVISCAALCGVGARSPPSPACTWASLYPEPDPGSDNRQHAGHRDLLYLDLALENVVRSAAERGTGAAGRGASSLVGPLLQNLVLSTGDNEELCYCLKAWQDLPGPARGGQYPSKETALKVLPPPHVGGFAAMCCKTLHPRP